MNDDIDPNELRDLYARLTAEEDQAYAGIRAMAARLGTYRKSLIIAGFDPPTEVFELVRDYHNFLLDRYAEPATSDD